MEQRKLAFLITHLILRVRDYPPEAVDSLLAALDEIERTYDLTEKLTAAEWSAVAESRQDVTKADLQTLGIIASKRSARKEDLDALNKEHFEAAVKRVRLREGDEQGDIADLLFALLDEYFLDIDGLR